MLIYKLIYIHTYISATFYDTWCAVRGMVVVVVVVVVGVAHASASVRWARHTS